MAVSITDAIGHGVDASLLATLAVSALRNQRRRGEGLLEQAGGANRALFDHAADRHAHSHDVRYVTGLLLALDFSDGRAQVVNAGHLQPRLLREGQSREVTLSADFPFGIFADTSYRVQELDLQPGDRLVLLSDGVLDREGMSLEAFDRMMRDTAGAHPREAAREVIDAVVGKAEGPLRDDATVVVVDWHGEPPGRWRSTVSGSDQARHAE